MSKVFGHHRVEAVLFVEMRERRSDPNDVRPMNIEMTVDLDALLMRLGERACRSKSGKSTGMHGAIVVRRKK